MQPTRLHGRVLIVAGSDSGGGAGIQADIKTVTALGGYAATAITAVTVQNTLGVSAVHAIPPETVGAQIDAVLSDIGADAVKTGMMANAETIEAVCRALDKREVGSDLVVDPVMIAKGGARLIDEDAIDTLKRMLLRRAAMITPNLPEAEVLIGRKIASVDDMLAAIEPLRALGPHSVLIKGGHLPGDHVVDIFSDGGTPTIWRDRKIETRHTHGTGCTLASAIATGLAQNLPPRVAIARARAYVRKAIETAPGIGKGHGPLNHAHTVRPMTEE